MIRPDLKRLALGAERGLAWGALVAAVSVGAWLRWPGLLAGYPYLTYVDEGHVLQPARETLARGRWEPEMSAYPALPDQTIALAARLLSPFAGKLRLAPPLDQVRPGMSFYDRVEPPELILVARAISWLLGVGVVALAGLLGRRLGGPWAAIVAAWAAAIVPAFVMRGAIVMVDAWSTFFAAAAFVAVPLADDRRLYPRSFIAGACGGMAAISKYPAAVVLPGIAVVLMLLGAVRLGRRCRAVALAGAGAAVAVATIMPATWQQPGALLTRFQWIAAIYRDAETEPLWHQIFEQHEFDLPRVETPELGYVFVAAAFAGFALLVLRPRSRAFGAGATVFVMLLVGLTARYSFQAFRNLLPAVPLACAALGVAVAALGERLGRPRITTAVAVAVLGALLLPASLTAARLRGEIVDSRHQAVQWLIENRLRNQSLLVAAEAAIPRLEVERLGENTVTAPWPEWPRRLRRWRPRFLLTGDLWHEGLPLIAPADRAWILRRYQVVATYGAGTADSGSWSWRGNHLRVWVFRRRPPSAPGPATP